MKKFLTDPLSNLTAIVVNSLLAFVLAVVLGAPLSSQSQDTLALDSGTSNFGNVAVAGTLAVTGAATFATGDVGAAEIADVTRTINLPLFSWIDCTTNAGAAIGFDTTADTLPDFVNSSTDGLGFQIAWDDTGGSLDVGYVCNTVAIPANYVSGGALTLVMSKDAATTNAEFVNCQGSIDGAALGVLGTTAVAPAAIAAYTCTPTLTGLAAGDSLGVAVYVTATTALDDIVYIHAAEFTYTATQ